ncbi:MAG: PEP-CTERM sorting domain-containing protein [Planctomycetota bacterium]|nr:PEP-CTERM sorting domain-containing protein [Planctomycetota bacterium]
MKQQVPRRSIQYSTCTVATSCALLLGGWFAPPAAAAVLESGDVVNIVGPPAQWIIGDTGIGQATINGGTSSSRNVVLVGNQATGDGTLNVDGVGSQLYTLGDIQIGLNGLGNMTVSGGATVFTNQYLDGGFTRDGIVEIGRNGTGELTVTGTDSWVNSTGDVPASIGSFGNGTLHVESGARFATANSLSVGVGGGTGIANINGGTLEIAEFLYLANSDIGTATLNVTNGAHVSTGSLAEIGGFGSGELNVSASTMQVGFNRRAGFTGTDGQGTVRLTEGADVIVNNSADIGGTADGTLEVSASKLEIGGQLSVGVYSGDSLGTANLTNGAEVIVHGFRAEVGGSGVGTMNIIGSKLSIPNGDFYAGLDFGEPVTGKLATTVSISAGSTLDAADDFYVAFGAHQAIVTVTDADTTINIGDRLHIAWDNYNQGVADGTLLVGRGAVINALELAPGEGDGGLLLAKFAGDQATLGFIIGDDGTGQTAGGLINTSKFNFGAGTATFGLTVDDGTTLTIGDSFTLIDYANWDNKLFSNMADDGLFVAGDYEFLINYDDDLGSGNLALTATVVSAIPEPTSLALLAVGSLAALSFYRRRRAV